MTTPFEVVNQFVRRLKVPGGWLYEFSHAQGYGTTPYFVAFVAEKDDGDEPS